MFVKKITLSQQIFFSTIILVSFSLAIVAWININQIKKDTTNYNIERLARKDRAVAKSIEAMVDYSLPVSQAFSQILSEISHIHKIKINIYDLTGHFITTSDLNLVGDTLITSSLKKETIDACYAAKDKKIEYEKGGYFGTYRILYIPRTALINSDDPAITLNPYCILDVVYDKSTKREIDTKTNQQIKNLVKLYLMLLLFAIVFSFVLLKQITSGLRSISKHLTNTSVNNNLQPLHWPVQDEIGQLVESYNKLIKELDIKTKQLIKSEKEGAWKKMAKQIAHEIKNPLTPMRLSVQYLEKSFKDGKGRGLYTDEWGNKLMSFSKTMIQQIDTLTRIANAFSDFASLNAQNLEKTCIIKEVARVVTLFKNNNVNLVSSIKSKKAIYVMIDRSHLTRVLNNLINNSLQAQRDTEPIRVSIKIEQKKQNCVVKIIDNGTGIPTEIQDRIFEPNFTTKSSGTGLGLSMVKKIVDDFKGRITYTTSNRGTTFEIIIPICNQNQL
jgi:two-component system nitrogen regulation sensor histidine kinase NtrY